MRSKGATVTIDLAEATGNEQFAGFEVHLKHVGQGLVLRWQQQMMHHRVEEMRRMKQLRSEFSRTEWPELYAKRPKPGSKAGEEIDAFVTPEGALMISKIATSMLVDCDAKLTRDGSPIENPLEELDRLGVTTFLVGPAMEAQDVSDAQFPTRESPSDEG